MPQQYCYNFQPVWEIPLFRKPTALAQGYHNCYPGVGASAYAMT